MLMQNHNALTLDFSKDIKIQGIDVYMTKVSSDHQNRHSNMFDPNSSINEESKLQT